jgi:Tat protein translocase TatB subunit
MFNIGFTELVILCVIGLLVIGPEQLPDMARKIAKMLNELKRAKDEMMTPVEDLKNQALQAVERARRQIDEDIHSPPESASAPPAGDLAEGAPPDAEKKSQS